ncbi:MAG: cupredoxin domain-containing protein [Nanoarchaeota archaeon]
MKIKKTTLYFALVLILIVTAGYFLLGKNEISSSNQIPNTENGDVQKIVLGVKNLNYYPNTITVESGKPVRIYLDETVSGCLRSFAIREFGISKYLKTPQDSLVFTPTKKGTFGFSCSMGMGRGTLVVT